VTVVCFDSAWTDNASAPGAICALSFDSDGGSRFHEPRLATFSAAASFLSELKSPAGMTLLALDQPTIVPNLTSLRPVERAVASVISWMGGGVQPSNRSKVGMFCDAAPIWDFLRRIAATELPESGRTATSGLHVIEVFPALALAALEPTFLKRLAAPRYNPARRKTFRLDDWVRVATAAELAFVRLGFTEPAEWCRKEASRAAPAKADQDKLDSMLCLLVGLIWRLRPRHESLMLGDLETGYMIVPASEALRQRLDSKATACGVLVR
jgi:predicted RNase H-like nuclease